MSSLSELEDDEDLVVGLGSSIVLAAGGNVERLRVFPSLTGPGIEIPSTQTAAFCWLRSESDRGELIHRSLELEQMLDPLELSLVIDSFKHDPTPSGVGRDLSGYEDGTENPTGDERFAAAIVSGRGAGLDGSSFVAVQKWQHDLVGFEAMTEDERDNITGRRQSDNEEIEDAPESAHVKRTAQESFEPEAFVVASRCRGANPTAKGSCSSRSATRSMPTKRSSGEWSDSTTGSWTVSFSSLGRCRADITGARRLQTPSSTCRC